MRIRKPKPRNVHAVRRPTMPDEVDARKRMFIEALCAGATRQEAAQSATCSLPWLLELIETEPDFAAIVNTAEVDGYDAYEDWKAS